MDSYCLEKRSRYILLTDVIWSTCICCELMPGCKAMLPGINSGPCALYNCCKYVLFCNGCWITCTRLWPHSALERTIMSITIIRIRITTTVQNVVIYPRKLYMPVFANKLNTKVVVPNLLWVLLRRR